MGDETVTLTIPARWLKDRAVPIGMRTLLAHVLIPGVDATAAAIVVGAELRSVLMSRKRLTQARLLRKTVTPARVRGGKTYAFTPQ